VLARIRTAQGKQAEAAELLLRCLAILDPVVVPEHPERLTRRQEYATLLRQLGREGEAAELESKTMAAPVEVVGDRIRRANEGTKAGDNS
jgi:hypothetical protein